MKKTRLGILDEEEKEFLANLRGFDDPEPEIGIDESTGFVSLTDKGILTKTSVFVDVKNKRLINVVYSLNIWGWILTIFTFPLSVIAYLFHSAEQKKNMEDMGQECMRRFDARFSTSKIPEKGKGMGI